MAEADADTLMVERLREIAGGRLLIRQQEAASALGISRRTLVEEIEAGRLPWVKVGKRRRFKPADLLSYIKKQEIGGWRHESLGRENLGLRDEERPSSRFAAGSTTKTSRSPVILDFANALAQATGTLPKPSLRRQKPQRSSGKHPK